MADQSEAYKAGYERGTAAGTWATDGNTTDETRKRILQGYDDGDPEILDTCPWPLSGEWAGESIPELSAEYDLDLFDDEIASEFENGFSDGYWAEVIRSCKAVLA